MQKDKIDNPDEYEILSNLIHLSNKEDAKVLIWPESAIPILLQYNPEIIELIIDNLPKESEILIGNITFQEDKFRNSALLIDQDKKIRDIYHKVHLVPFGEYMPFQGLLLKLPFMKIITGDIGFESGKEIKSINMFQKLYKC